MFERLRFRLASAIIPKEASEMMASMFTQMGGRRSSARRGTSELILTYRTSPVFRGVVSKIASHFAAVPWVIYAVADRRVMYPTARTVPEAVEGGKAVRDRKIQEAYDPVRRRKLLDQVRQQQQLVEIVDHPMMDLLMQAIPHAMTGLKARKLTQTYLDIAGETFWLLKLDPVTGKPVEYWPIPPSWVQRLPEPSRQTFVIQIQGGSILEMPAEQVIWFRDIDPADPYGRGSGIGLSLGDELESDEYAANMVKTFFLNRGKPELLVGVKGISKEDARAAKEEFEREHRGFWRAHRSWWHSGDVTVQELQTKFTDMELVELRSWERDAVISTYGVPPEILGILVNCLDDQTECLTRRGWITHGDLSETDEIATWNDAAARMEFHQPNEIMRYDFDGKLHHWHNENRGGTDFMCTPNHRLWVKHGRRRGERDGWVFATSEDVAGWTSAYWRTTGGGIKGTVADVVIPGKWHGNARPGNPRHRCDHPKDITISAEVFASFLGYWIAEGWAEDGDRQFSVLYSQNKGLTAGRMKEAMESLGVGDVYVRERIKQDGGNVHVEFRVANKALWHWVNDNVGRGSGNKKLPDCVFDWAPETQRALFDALIEGDGTLRVLKNKKCYTYASVSEQLVDDVQRLCVYLGLSAYKYKPSNQNVFILSISERIQRSLDRYGNKHGSATWVREVDYNGIVWCVNVENHRFFTRRNGCVSVHGNSNKATITASRKIFVEEVLIPRLEDMRAELQMRLAPMFDERLIIDYEPPQPDDKELRLEALKAIPWAASRGEIREEFMGLPHRGAIDDFHFVPAMLIPQRVPEDLGELMLTTREHKLLPAKTVKELAFEDIDNVLEALRPERLTAEVRPMWSEEFRKWGEDVTDELGLDPAAFDMLNPLVADHLNDFYTNRIADIDQTTLEQLRATLTEGVRAGEDIRRLSIRVGDTFEVAKGYRSRMIARTETTRSSNAATFSAHVQSGIVEARQWIATLNNTRDTHLELNGTVVGLDEPFYTENGEAMYPGDFGVAGEDINCGCGVFGIVGPPLEEDALAALFYKLEADRRPWNVLARRAFVRGFGKQEDDVISALEEYE